VKAPFGRHRDDVPRSAPGKYLQSSMTAFYLVATDHVWVDSNPKETQLTNVRAGQPVTVTVDPIRAGVARHRREHQPAAAQEFALLPAQNTSATG